MLSSISPVGERARGQRWGLTATAYLVGSLLGGAAVGGLAGGLGAVLVGAINPAVRTALVGVVAVVGVLCDAAIGVPSWHRQVDERWLGRYRGWVYGAGFGLQLGTGVATIVPSSVVYALWGGVLLTASPAAGALLGALFGAARAMPVMAAGRIRSVAALRRALAWMDRVREAVTRLSPAVQAVLGGTALLLATNG